MPRIEELIVVLGMHRSGTSLTAQIINEIGIPVIGKQGILANGDQYNPQGYWETSELVTINQRVLLSLGSEWDNVPRFSPQWWEKWELNGLRKRARGFVEHITQDKGTWKDPRMSLTYPFWAPILPKHRFVVCVRNPLNVSLSLERRDNMPMLDALNLWMVYTAHAIRHSYQENPLIVFYDDLVSEAGGEQVERLGEYLGVRTQSHQATRLIQQNFSHGVHELEEILHREDVPQHIKDFWELLLQWRAAGFPEMPEIYERASQFNGDPVNSSVWAKGRVNFWLREVKMRTLEDWSRGYVVYRLKS